MKATDYLKSVLYEGEKRCKVKKSGFDGIDRSCTFDSGALSTAVNIDTSFLPALRSARREELLLAGNGGTPLGALAYGDTLFTVFKKDGKIMATRTQNGESVSAVLSDNGEDERMRCIVAFNRYSSPLDALSGAYEKLLLIFPDKKCCFADADKELSFEDISSSPMPDIQYATVHMSRVFGVDGDRVYASAFNDCSNWELDTASDIGAENAWATTSQSNTKALGGFTAVACCDGYAVCFRDDFMQQVYNNKNPFRLVDIGAWGCNDGYSHTSFNSALAFVSKSGVWLYAGGYPRLISEKLCINDFSGARVAASDELLYLYIPAEDRVFVYENTSDSWGERDVKNVSLLISNGKRVFAIKRDMSLTELDVGEYGEFCAETDFMSLGVQNPKMLKGIAATAELGENSELSVAVVYNGGEARAVHSASEGLQVIRSAIKVSRDDFAKIRLYGRGKVDIFGISLSFAYEDTAGGM
ncbi:MAG: hypothetical protein IKM09_03815 [Clostridia bacterium]|nr:hypothetical protein [Clostridia bacterium]